LLHEKQYESHAAFESMLLHYQRLSFLIIDEVTEGCGKGANLADWERHLLRVVVDVRYQANCCTLVISNRSKEEIIERLGEPTVDRLSEKGATFAFNWPSCRQEQG
jgi:DNA replication protein DnaC